MKSKNNITREQLLQALLCGGFLRKTMNHNGLICYKLYDAAQRPIRFVHRPCHRMMRCLHIKNKHRHQHYLTLNLHLLRQEHGNSYLQRTYKAWKANSYSVKTPEKKGSNTRPTTSTVY